MKQPEQIFFFSSTHWDREWYQPFQAMRFRLAETLDELIDVLEKRPEFELFCMDGQTIVLEDYMQAAPENRARLQKLIDDGRIKIGPWYVMPDTRLVSGESLIENFLMGRRIAARWKADTWKFGYMCDIFGHIAQMPQILKGFGMDCAYLGRGVHTGGWRGLFRWQSPDKTEIYGYYSSYASFTNQVTRHYDDADYEDRLKGMVEKEFMPSKAPVIVLADAVDHAPVNPHTPEILQDLKKLYPQSKVTHESLENLAKAAAPYRDQLPVIQGELIDTAWDRSNNMRLVGQSMSSYYPIKYRNDDCQNYLEKMVRPLNAFGRLLGGKDRPALMEKCVDYLLQNHPHDSICGCSIDQVHIDMHYRYDQMKAIGSELVSRAQNALWVKPGEKGDRLEILNPFCYDWLAPVRLEIPFPAGYAHTFAESAGYTQRNAFRLVDANGKEIPYQIHGIRKNVSLRTQDQKSEKLDLYDVSFAADLAAASVTSLEIRPSALPVRYGGEDFRLGVNFCDNGLIRFEIGADGTVSIWDHETGECYHGLNRYLDDGEDGNGWFHDAPIGDVKRMALSPVKVERIAHGPAQAAFKVVQKLPLPMGREDTRETELTLETIYTLGKGDKFVQVDMTLDNTAADHRLLASLPMGREMKKYYSGQAFCCVERETGLDPERVNWDEQESLEKSMNGILFGQDEKGGLAFVSAAGLHEGGMDQDGAMSITLLRSFSRAYLVDRPEACKLLGKHHFRYAMAVMNQKDSYADLLKIQDRLCAEFTARFGRGEAEMGKSLLKLNGEKLQISAVKAPEDGDMNAVIVRLWNASAEKQRGVLESGFALKNARYVALDETCAIPATFDQHQIPLEIGPWEIVTLRLDCEKKG